MSVADLKTELRQNGMSTMGRRKKLVARLSDWSKPENPSASTSQNVFLCGVSTTKTDSSICVLLSRTQIEESVLMCSAQQKMVKFDADEHMPHCVSMKLLQGDE